MLNTEVLNYNNVRDEIHAETVKLAQVHDFDSIAETLWLKVKIDKKKAALLCCLYRPPSTNHNRIHADFNNIEDQIQSVITMYPSHRIILAGDLNADSKTNPLAHSRLRELEKLSLNCVVTEPTFFRGDTQSVRGVVLLSDTMCTASTLIQCQVERSDYSCHHRRVCVTGSHFFKRPRHKIFLLQTRRAACRPSRHLEQRHLTSRRHTIHPKTLSPPPDLPGASQLTPHQLAADTRAATDRRRDPLPLRTPSPTYPSPGRWKGTAAPDTTGSHSTVTPGCHSKANRQASDSHQPTLHR